MYNEKKPLHIFVSWIKYRIMRNEVSIVYCIRTVIPEHPAEESFPQDIPPEEVSSCSSLG